MLRLCVAALAVLAFLVAGCGTETDSAVDRPASSAVADEPRDESPEVTIESPSDGDETTSATAMITGTASPPDAEIRIGSRTATTDAGGSWEREVKLDLGDNTIEVIASAPGSSETADAEITVTRKRTAAERKAFRAAQERRRLARLDRLRANAREIDPKQLQKNPDRYAGDQVVITGEIFQIQEGDGENFFLMNTECETEFDITFCNGPTVHVTYGFSTEKTEEDIVTVYGTVAGGYGYDTQSGGTNFVGSVEAKIIE
jgi:hypothetical protein